MAAGYVPRDTYESPEPLIAAARVVVSLIVFAAILAGLGPLHSPIVKLVTGAYVLHSCVAAWAAWASVRGWWCSAGLVHLVDLAFATAATSISGGPASHAFPLFVLVLVASAYRWGLRRTLIDSVLVGVIASAQSLAAAAGWTAWAFELDWFVLWAPFLVVLPALVATLSDRQRALNGQAVAIVRVVSRINRASDVESAFRGALASTVGLSGAREALLAMEELDTRRSLLVHVVRHDAGAEVSQAELSPRERDEWFEPLPPAVSIFEARRRRASFPLATRGLALDREGNVVERAATPPAALVQSYGWSNVVGIAIDDVGAWEGRLYLLDPSAKPGGATRLRFIQALVRRAAPALVNMYLVRKLRSRAGSQERARVSRELHDGVVQSLIALDMHLDVLQKRAQGTDRELADQMEDFRDRLHQEALNARDLMQRLRPVDVDVERLPHELQDVVERFERVAGVRGRLDWVVNGLHLSPRECREVVRLVQEALVNVRRHSGASRATVRVEADVSGWGLVIEDDGKGLGFSGRLTHAELRRMEKGPRVIRERVEAMGGELSVESSARGTRLEMAFPCVQD